jgi:hypothetical protein
MTGQATFSREDDGLVGVPTESDFLVAGLSADPLPLEADSLPLPLEADSLEGVLAEESPDCLSLAVAAAELEPFLLSLR